VTVVIGCLLLDEIERRRHTGEGRKGTDVCRPGGMVPHSVAWSRIL